MLAPNLHLPGPALLVDRVAGVRHACVTPGSRHLGDDRAATHLGLRV